MRPPQPRSRNSLSDWNSSYFGVTTLLVAVAVLIVSVQIGRYIGRQSLVHDVPSAAKPAAIHVLTAKHPAKGARPAHPAHLTPAHRPAARI